MTRVVVLDLDDTLYLERDYVRSGFEAVGRHLQTVHGIDGFAAMAWSLFEQGKRGRVFDEVLSALGCSADETLIASLVDIYRHHRPNIALCPDAATFLRTLARDEALALISDGPVASQSAKLAALGLESRFGIVILSDAWGVEFRKPHPRGFARVEEHWPLVDRSRFLYVADNPLKDFITPKARGWRTIRIIREGGEHRARPMAAEHAADETISTFDDLRLD